MNTLKMKPLFLAIAGVTAIGAVGAAQAVSVNPTGLGQVLIYPYYTVKGSTAAPFNTLISIVNTTASTKAVKIRFREGKASKEVLDFNIFLSPHDVWVAGLSPSASGGVLLNTGDKSCTIPAIPTGGVEFKNNDYKSDAVDDASLTRLQEGYIEVFEMASYTDGSVIAVNSKHDSTGTPKDCSKVTNSTADSEQQDPFGGLSGTASLVQPGTGLNAATDATALANFRNSPFYRDTGTLAPTLADADPWNTLSIEYYSNRPNDQVWSTWSFGEDAVSAAIMKSTIINEFVLDAATASATDWVITFPTKSFYVFETDFFAPFEDVLGTGGSCDDVSVELWNREEKASVSLDFSPSENAQLCWEANVVTFNSKNVFGSSNTLPVGTTFTNGWGRITFLNQDSPSNNLKTNLSYITTSQSGSTPSTFSIGSDYYFGLPAIGFAVQTFRPNSTSSYAGTFFHRWEPGW